MKYIFLTFILVTLSFGEDYCNINEVKSVTTKSSMQKWLDSDFGLRPYRANYLLPYAYSSSVYQSKVPTVEYRNVEAELQISLQLQVAHNILGLNEKYFISYSHKAFWQFYIKSAPFRESNYNPEAFVIFPIEDSLLSVKLHSLKLAIAHRSNGQPNTKDIVFDQNQSLGNLSRSVNYVYFTLRFQHKTLLLDLTAWVRLPENDSTDDNPDLTDYTGYTNAKLTYFLGDHMFTLMGRGNLHTSKGAIEATYSYPLVHNYFYLKLFSGYTESLIDYNNYLSKVSIGFSFSR